MTIKQILTKLEDYRDSLHNQEFREGLGYKIAGVSEVIDIIKSIPELQPKVLEFADWETLSEIKRCVKEGYPREKEFDYFNNWIHEHLVVKPQLPANLDEAAERYAEANTKEEYHTDEGVIQTYGIAYEGYKQGWMDRDAQVPKWKKNGGLLRFAILEDEKGRYVQHDGYKIYFNDLLKLPKED